MDNDAAIQEKSKNNPLAKPSIVLLFLLILSIVFFSATLYIRKVDSEVYKSIDWDEVSYEHYEEYLIDEIHKYGIWETVAEYGFYIIFAAFICYSIYCIVIWIKAKKHTYQTSPSISSTSAKTTADKELRFRCNVCGHVFCYTQEEYNRNENQKKAEFIGQMATGLQRGLGNNYAANEARKATAGIRNGIKDYSKCPHCNSSDISQITGNASFTAKKEDDSVSALEKLAKLHDQGIITDEEFQQKKAELLAKM